VLGKAGVERVIELKLDAAETNSLEVSRGHVQEVMNAFDNMRKAKATA
jgi:malate/lactate dehydrogenase